jgi:arylsulfatase A-like enzyme
MRMLPELLKTVGYRTAHVGKWHLGAAQMANIPNHRGFDQSFGFLMGSADHFTEANRFACKDGSLPVDLWDGSSMVPPDTQHSCFRFANRAVEMIHHHDPEDPLFMYVALAEGHGPYNPVPGFTGEQPDELESYRGMIACADRAAGDIVDALRRQGMWANTLMLWSSDNGGVLHFDPDSNKPFRGAKGSMYEGGVRVAAFLAGGAVPVTAPRTYDGMVHVGDWFATLAALAGVSDSSDHSAVGHGLPDIDSINLWPQLTGAASGGRDEILLGTRNDNMALIRGEWKLISQEELPPYTTSENVTLAQFELYNIEEDPSEEHDQTTSHPTVKRNLFERFKELAATSFQTGETEVYQSAESTATPCQLLCSSGCHVEGAPVPGRKDPTAPLLY